MKDAFGGIVNILLISIFLVIISSSLGMIVNYTKAFRMKNYVISEIEKYESYGCFENGDLTDCKTSIINDAQKIGYHPPNLACPTNFTKIDNIFCYEENSTDNGNKYYSVVTQVDLDLPIINRIMAFPFFQVHGDTRIIKDKYSR